MKNLLLLCLLIYFAGQTNAQNAYSAVYKYSFADTASFDKMILQNLKAPSLLSYKRGDTDARKLKLVAQLKKEIYNNETFTCFCYPGYTAIDYAGGESNMTVQKNAHSVLHVNCTSITYNIFNYANNSYYAYNRYLDTETIHCQRIDPTQLHFVSTGKKKMINKWKCREYRLHDTSNILLSLWVTSELPAYVHPGVFSNDVKGGIVELDYKDEKISLVEAEVTNYKFVLPKYSTDTIKQTYNFMTVINDTYHDAMGE